MLGAQLRALPTSAVSMSKRRKRGHDRLHHAAVERELRRLNDNGALVERQRDLMRTVLMALVFKLGGSAELGKVDFELARGGKLEVADLEGDEGGLRAIFLPREGVSLRPAREPSGWWARLWVRVWAWFR